MNKRYFIYPGSFDPITNGHLDLINRAAKLCDKLYIVIGVNNEKSTFFDVDTRIRMLKETTKHLNNVVVDYTPELIVNYCEKNNIGVILRGFRNSVDFEFEQEMNFFNTKLNPNIETIVLFSTLENKYVSSSNIKELVKNKVDITNYVPKEILKYFN